MTYTSTIRYIVPEGLYDQGVVRFDVGNGLPEETARVMPRNPMYSRATEDFNHEVYMYPAPPVYLGQRDLDVPDEDYSSGYARVTLAKPMPTGA